MQGNPHWVAGERTQFPRIVIAASASGAGKTSTTAGILAASAKRGRPVSPFKCGPDFLDPQVLRAAAGAPSASNLDRWLTDDATLLAGFRRHAKSGPRALNLIEGVMGVLDSSSWGTSTADVANALDAPIVLVVDASRAAESVALQVRGAAELLPPGRLAGAIVNRVGLGWHALATRREIEERCGVPVLGSLPWSPEIELPDQPLGLLTPITRPGLDWSRKFRALGDWVADGVDLERLTEIAQGAGPLPRAPGLEVDRDAYNRASIAVAQDAGFCFTYPENLEAFLDRGARVESFSPIAGDALPPSADAVYLPGGYPESHAAALSCNRGLARELRAWVRDRKPLLAECGGMMVLLDHLVDAAGSSHRMSGAFRGSTRIQPQLAGFGYGEAHLRRRSLLGNPGGRVRGHVYHHSRRTMPASPSWAWLYLPRNGAPPTGDGLHQGLSVASYLHVRLDEYPHIVNRMLSDSP